MILPCGRDVRQPSAQRVAARPRAVESPLFHRVRHRAAAIPALCWRSREAAMERQGERMVFVATDEGLHVFDVGNGVATDGRRVDDLAGREIRALEPGGGGPWAIVDGEDLWRRAGDRWSPIASMGRRKATCLAATSAGLLIGTARAHLLRLEHDQVVPNPAFDQAEGREAWYTPWGAPADVRSISAGPDGAVYVNVHVGGVLRSTDGGATWRP